MKWVLIFPAAVFIILFGAAEAYFTDLNSQRFMIRTAYAELKLVQIQEAPRPEELTEETVFSFSYQIENSGNAAVYISDDLEIWLDHEKITDQNLYVLIPQYKTEPVLTQPGEVKEFSYLLSIPGIIQNQSQYAELKVCSKVEGFTDIKQEGFSAAPLCLEPVNFTGDEALELPVKEYQIRLRGIYIPGNQNYQERWYCSTEEISDGDRMSWEIFNASEWITVTVQQPLNCRFELVSEAGTVRSDIYRYSVQDGTLKTEIYDYFTGEYKGQIQED